MKKKNRRQKAVRSCSTTSSNQNNSPNFDFACQEETAINLINQGELEKAERLYNIIIDHGYGNHVVYSNLAAVCGMQGKYQDVIRYLEASIKIDPGYPDAYYNLGLAYAKLEQIDSAINYYEAAIQLRPVFPEAYNNLGLELQKKGFHNEAIQCFDTAISQNIQHSEAFLNKGISQEAMANVDGALSSYQSAIQLRPNNIDALNNLSILLATRGDLKDAAILLNEALTHKPDFYKGYINLGNIYKELGDIESALSSYSKALAIKGDSYESLYNIATTLFEKGDVISAISSFKKALAINPSYIHAKYNLSMAELMIGNYRTGWMNYESRFDIKANANTLHAKPRIPRLDLNDKRNGLHILVVSEQGLGDTLMFSRFIQLLRDQGHIVTFCAQPSLHSLIKESGIDDNPLSPSEANKILDGFWIPLLSLPLFLYEQQDTLRSINNYISPNSDLLQKWKHKLSGERKPVIGIHWQGNPNHETTSSTRGRSLRLNDFASIARCFPGSLLSLQKGYGTDQLLSCSFTESFVSCQDEINQTYDFSETAAIAACCDLIITNDTSIAHLAGGMGLNTWLLLKKVPEWRWGLTGDTTHWYQTLQLIRQHEEGNWLEVMERVVRRLSDEGYLNIRQVDDSPIVSKLSILDPITNNLSIQNLQVFCISLSDAISRRSSIEQMRHEFCLNIRYIDAIDGRGLSREEMDSLSTRRINWKSAGGHQDEIALTTEVACYLSHITAWETIISEGLDSAIVIEDDVYCTKYDGLELPSTADFVYLSDRAHSDNSRRVVGPVCGSEAYYLTKECAKKLLMISQELSMPVDIQWLPQMENLVKTGHFISKFHNSSLPTINAYALPGVFRLSVYHDTSQIGR